MAESTSPTISRSPQKLDYPSSIKTTLPSPSTVKTFHSSFDFISEPRDCETLTSGHPPHVYCTPMPSLEADLRQLDLDSSRRIIPSKNRKLDRTESISMPTTPTEQLSPSYKHPYHQLMALKNGTNDIDDEQPAFSFPLPTDYMNAMPDADPQTPSPQIPDEAMLHSKR